MNEIDVYVLGAGASRVHGAPTTDEILEHALTKIDDHGVVDNPNMLGPTVAETNYKRFYLG